MNKFRARLAFVTIILVLGCGVVIHRLFTVQVMERERYMKRSRDQTQQRRIVQANRGAITDRFGRTLAVSIDETMSIDPDVLGVKEPAMKKSAQVKRIYPLGDVAGSLLGYVGTDGYGLGGAELSFDGYLRGEDGWAILQKDGRNFRYRKIGLPEKAPRNGCDVALTVDINIQKITQTVIRQAVTQLRAKSGMCIVMNPQTGSILAMVDEPSFNPNMPGRTPIAQRCNRCIGSVYEPGSTFKIVTASIALEEKIKYENDLIYGDNGSYRIYDQVIRDHKPYGYLTFAKAITYSSNVCFAKVANEIGNDKFYRYVRDFGFGTRTAIDLPGEECGIVHPVKRWSGRTRVTMAIGQELSATLLQMVLPFAAVANGGVLVSPRILEKVISPDGQTIDSGSYRPVRRVLSESVASRLRVMLQDVVDNGTGKKAAMAHIAVAGKTGTSQKPDSSGYSQTRSWSSFIGFVPANDPKLLCGVVIDEPANDEMGGEAAAPIFKKIITQIISHPELEFAEEILKSGTVTVSSPGLRVEATEGTDSCVTKTDAFNSLPDCIGKDVRDAVNIVNGCGVKPFVVGYGIVNRQVPLAGTKIAPAASCTLFCATKG